MAEYYYQIKAKNDEPGGFSNWTWPPIFSGKVEAENKKDAKGIIEQNYSRKFPLRVLKKDLVDHNFLLNIREIKSDDTKTKDLFNYRSCKKCERSFRVIDKYNDSNERDKGFDFCCDSCRSKHQQENRIDRDFSYDGIEQPVIYKITNWNTGKSYIGKTTQVFTLRWYQHFYHGGSCKFHQAIKNSKIEEWNFAILEAVDVPKDENKSDYVSSREKFWIDKLNTVEGGYNTQQI